MITALIYIVAYCFLGGVTYNFVDKEVFDGHDIPPAMLVAAFWPIFFLFLVAYLGQKIAKFLTNKFCDWAYETDEDEK